MTRGAPLRSRSVRCLLLAGFLVMGACRAPKEEEGPSIAWLIRHGRYAEALERAEKDANDNPGDEVAQTVYRDARVAYVLELGREAVFAGAPEEGLSYFEEALALAPDNAVVRSWVDKTRLQLAVEWMDRASEFNASEQLNDAEQAYEKVLEYVPDHQEASFGLSRILLLKNYRAGQSRSYFVEGIEAFRQFLLPQSRRDFHVSYDYDETNVRAGERRAEVEKLLAEERIAEARALEEQGLYHAARNEYRLALVADPGNETARDGLDHMDRETRADRLLSEADMHVRRGELERAEELIEQGVQLTEDQTDRTGALNAEIEEARLRSLYDEARALERDFLYPEAVEAYDRLLAEVEFYEDTLARRETILEFIALAEEYYAKALEAPTDKEAAEYLRQIRVFWPEYRDVEQRLAEIEARLAEKDGESSEGGD